ncbi:MAG: YicC/YloC family endoribonuclease, partial [Candidatus Acidiferrales bacterium]
MSHPTLRSMTGYAQTRVEKDGWAVQLSMRSVNHRFLDVRVRMPEGWDALEMEIRKVVQGRFRRGHVEVALQVQAAKNNAVAINREAAAAYWAAARSLGEEFGVKAELDVAAILRLPGVTSSAPPPQEIEKLAATVLSGLTAAIDQLDEMRGTEGRALGEELARRLTSVEEAT